MAALPLADAPADEKALARDWRLIGASDAAYVAGVVTALAGLIIALGWPVNSLFILGVFLGFDLIFQGATLTAFGFALKRQSYKWKSNW